MHTVCIHTYITYARTYIILLFTIKKIIQNTLVLARVCIVLITIHRVYSGRKGRPGQELLFNYYSSTF